MILTRRSPGVEDHKVELLQAPGVLQVKIVEKALINIGLVRLFLW